MKLPIYKYLYAALDFMVIILSLIIAAFLSGNITSDRINLFAFEFINDPFSVLPFFFTIAFILVFVFQNNNLYKLTVCLTKASQLVAIIKSIFYGIIFLILISYFIKLSFILESRQFTFYFGIVSILLLVVYRVGLARFIFLSLLRDKIITKNLIIIGAGGAGRSLAAKLKVENDYGINILGFIDDNKPKGKEVLSGLKILGKVEDLPDLEVNSKIDELIIAIDNIDYERVLEILDLCNNSGFNVKITSELFEVISDKLVTEKYAEIPVIEASPRLNGNINLYFKRVFDFIFAFFGILLLFPFFLLIGILIKLSSKGPILFTHDRVGLNGKLFKFYKFRSMTVVEDDDANRKKMMLDFMKQGKTQGDNDTKIINHSRVTWIGKFIRKTSIDELPQLINVLKGEMSLVGPRPALPYEYENYDPWQKRRVQVLPGCTGLWQVSGRSNVTFNESVVLDLYYINNMTPWMDLQIIIKTLPVMLFARGGK